MCAVNICEISQLKVLGRHLHPEKCMHGETFTQRKRCIHTQKQRDADKDTQVCTHRDKCMTDIRTGALEDRRRRTRGVRHTLEKQRW